MSLEAEELQRWRLILGNQAEGQLSNYGSCCLSVEQQIMDEALSALYDGAPEAAGQRSAGLGGSAPRLAKWLGDIRAYFSEEVVAVIQADAIERKGLTQLLLEPETLKNVEPNIQLVSTLMSLRGQIPEQTKETARQVVQAVVERIKRLLEQKIRQAVMGALNRREHSPIANAASIDWKTTIARNLRNYNLTHRKLIPERVYFYSRAQRSHNWHIITAMDQSGSMADSVVYGSIIGSIFGSIPALQTRMVAFDTEVVDLTEQCGNDPVEMIFGIQLGGGTDINKAVGYCSQFVTEPAKTIFVLITDLFEGGNEAQLVRRLKDMKADGVRVLCLLALSDSGTPCFDERLATKLAHLGIPCFACTPQSVPDLLEGALSGADLQEVAKRLDSRKGGLV